MATSTTPFFSGTFDTNSTTSIDSLTLANGMTAGIGPEQQSNPQLGHNLGANLPWAWNAGPTGPPLRWGVMRTDPRLALPNLSSLYPYNGTPGGLNPASYYLYFLYNPTQIVDVMSVDTSTITPAQVVGQNPSSFVNPKPSVGAANSHSVSWSLFFDRTYDVLYSSNPGAERGVLKDVAALYNVMGAFTTGGTTPILYPVEVVFGQTAAGDIWGFTGFVSAATVTYGVFRYNMIPTRCTIDLTMTAVYLGPQVPSNDAPPGSALNSNLTQSGSGAPGTVPVQIQQASALQEAGAM